MTDVIIPDFVKSMPEAEVPLPGAEGWILQGEGQQAVFVEFNETVEVPEHTHDDQWEFALAGKVELIKSGSSKIYYPGESFFIPAGQPHGAKVFAGYKAMIIFNEPQRYKKK